MQTPTVTTARTHRLLLALVAAWVAISLAIGGAAVADQAPDGAAGDLAVTTTER
jgi:hypothetical protein